MDSTNKQKRRYISDEEGQRIIELLPSHTMSEIAGELGFTLSGISRFVKRNHLNYLIGSAAVPEGGENRTVRMNQRQGKMVFANRPEAQAALVECAKSMTTTELAKYFGCAVSSVVHWCNKLGIEPYKSPSTSFTERENDLIRQYAVTKTTREIADLMLYPYQAIVKQCKKLGVEPVKPVKTPYLAALNMINDPERINTIREMAKCKSIYQIAHELHSSPQTIKIVCERLDINIEKKAFHWNDELTQQLIEMAPTMTSADIAESLGCCRSSIIQKARSLNISCKRAPITGGQEGTPWTEAEKDVLREHFSEMGGFVSELLPGRTPSSCLRVAHRLGLYTAPKGWTEEEIRNLRENYPHMGKAVSSLLPGRTPDACQTAAHKYHIHRRYNTLSQT